MSTEQQLSTSNNNKRKLDQVDSLDAKKIDICEGLNFKYAKIRVPLNYPQEYYDDHLQGLMAICVRQQLDKCTVFASLNFDMEQMNDRKSKQALETFCAFFPKECFETQPLTTRLDGGYPPQDSRIAQLGPDHALEDIFKNHHFVSVVRSSPLLLADGLNPWVRVGQLSPNPSWQDLQELVLRWKNERKADQFCSSLNYLIEERIEECIWGMTN